jgi:hypothetical protein
MPLHVAISLVVMLVGWLVIFAACPLWCGERTFWRLVAVGTLITAFGLGIFLVATVVEVLKRAT